MKIKSIAAVILCGSTLSACMGNVSQTSANVMGLQSVAGVQRAAQAQPSSADLAMTCKDVQAELDKLYARTEEINKSERARERKTNFSSGLLNAGLSVVGAGAIANAGSAQAISNIGTATTVAGAAVSSTRNAQPSAQTINEATAIAERSSLLERVKLSKGC